MKIPPFQYRMIQPDHDVPFSVTSRGYVYVLDRARIMDQLVLAKFKLRGHS